MKHFLLAMATLWCVASTFSSFAADNNKWKPLFGKNLENANYNPEVWSETDGVLGAVKDESIWTKDEYENFELDLDFKTDVGTNSGVVVYCTDTKDWIPNSVEIQIADDHCEKWGNGKPYEKCGAIYGHLGAVQDKVVKKPGEWNHMRIKCAGQHIMVILNGKKVTEMDMSKWTSGTKNPDGSDIPSWLPKPFAELPTKGFIGLQGKHGDSLIWFRNIKIKELPRKTREARLFNGEDITNWDKYGTELWYVKDGLLVCESGPDKQYGYLATREYYDDFDLSVEFKQEKDGNSGVFIRSFVEEKDVKVNGWQVEVAPKGFDTGGIYESYGRGWLIQIPDEKENILKQGEWNTMRIRVQGDNVQTWLNGEEMVNIRDEKIGAGQGRIALQIHDGGGIKVLWRNLHLQTL